MLMGENRVDIIFQVRRFISWFSGIAIENIQTTSRLEKDLKIYGDDAVDLIVAYSKQFNVDISEFKFEDFIAPEGDTLLPALATWLMPNQPKTRKEIAVNDLVKGIFSRKLTVTTASKF